MLQASLKKRGAKTALPWGGAGRGKDCAPLGRGWQGQRLRSLGEGLAGAKTALPWGGAGRGKDCAPLGGAGRGKDCAPLGVVLLSHSHYLII